MEKVKVKVYSQNNEIPIYQTHGSAAVDIISNEECVIRKDKLSVISTGLFMEIPEGYRLDIRARSGLSSKGVIILNGIGTIDSDYRGEIKVIMTSVFDQGFTGFMINKGDRIAQAIIEKNILIDFDKVDDIELLSKTERGLGGFGSTGK